MERFVIRMAAMSLLFTISACAAVTVTITSKRIILPEGNASITVQGSVTGYAVTDYLVRAETGQTMTVALKSSNSANYFNVLPPGSNDIAVFTGSVGGNRWTGMLNNGGDYKLRIYLMRSAARRNETGKYTLSVALADAPKDLPSAAAPAGDIRIKATPFHATGKVPCIMGNGPWGSQQCPFGVMRGSSGNAELHLAPPKGFERVLTFRDGNVTSDKGSEVKAEKHDGMWFIEVNGYEHYQVPDAVILGN